MMFIMPVMNAIPIDAENPILAMASRPMKFSNATPAISRRSPRKYLVSRALMSPIAAFAFASCLSGTRDEIILEKRSLSLKKKKLIKTTEKRAIPVFATIDVTELIADEMIDASKIFWICSNTAFSILKFLPNAGNLSIRKLLNSSG